MEPSKILYFSSSNCSGIFLTLYIASLIARPIINECLSLPWGEYEQMAYDEQLEQRVRALLQQTSGIEDKNMFGGVAFLLHGNMACGILNNDLIVRVGPEGYEDALALPHSRKFDISGRAMKGWVMVCAKGHDSKKDLASWVDRGISFAGSLPKK